jgi:hypothetical protein
MVKPTSSYSSAQRADESRMEAERIRDVLLLLDNLARREEITTQLILDCLYEIGSKNLINNRFQSRSLNRLMKWIARMGKPAFRTVAVCWFKKNAPRLIADWLHSQVTFKPLEPQPQRSAIPETPLDLSIQPKLENLDREIRRLRRQMRYLGGLLIGASIGLGTLIGLHYSPQPAESQALPQASPASPNLPPP